MALIFANNYGLKKTIRFCTGVGAGFFLIIVLCSYFNILLKNFIPKIELAMTIFGAAYMIYLALKFLKSDGTGQNNDGEKHNSFISGMLLQFINPKGILYGITVTSTFIIPYYASDAIFIFFAFFLAFVGFLSTFCWGLFGSVFQKFLLKYRRQFNITMALLLVYTALSILIK